MTTKPEPAVSPSELISRRVILRRAGAALVAVPLLPLLSCATSHTDTDAGDAPDSGPTLDNGGADAVGLPWATGGTAAMKDKASYPNPFAASAPSSCALSRAMTVGPCYSAQSETIQDISYGHDGLPLRMYLQILDQSCAPVAGAVVDVWHVSAVGKYSITTQLFFADALDDEIVASQPIYDARGARDTTNQTDGVISGSAVADYQFQTAKMTDGAMLAWKTLVLRSALSDSLCAAPAGSTGSGGPGGPGADAGPPPGRG